MSTRVLIGGICEQDIDLFLLEECVSNRRFLAWLLSMVPGWPDDSRELLVAERFVSQGNGESDLELMVRDTAGRVGTGWLDLEAASLALWQMWCATAPGPHENVRF